MPVWFIAAPPLKLVVLLWQVSQAAVVAMWVLGLLKGVTPANAAPLWQVEQPLVMPVWFMAVPEKLVVLLWQVSQAAVVGIWLLGLVTTALVAAKLVLLAWQVAQPLVMPVWFIGAGVNEVVLV
jgi:hypothetical protein